LIKDVPGSSIYYHTHRFLQQHQYLSPEPPNDFAYWATGVLGEGELGERLASIDTIQFTTVRSLREKIASTIEDYFQEYPEAIQRTARRGEEFHFIKSVSFIMPTNQVAHDLKEFLEVLSNISINSIYFHMFEARLRLEKGNNDFSNWITDSLGNKKTADEIARLDPYTYTLDDLRTALIKIVKRSIKA
jgi:hypothetical protein